MNDSTVIGVAPPTLPKNRLGGLDILRGLAAVAVMLFHFSGDKAGHTGSGAPARLDVLQYGVHLFFTISGFVIVLTLERSKTWSDFVISRISRLYPTFWVCLALTWVGVTLLGLPGRETSLRDLAWNFTMMPTMVNLTFLRGATPVAPVDGVYWSLQIELIFYSLALCCWMLFGLGRLVWIVILWCVLAAAQPLIPQPLSRPIGFLLLLEWAPFFSIGILAFLVRRQGWLPPCLLLAFVIVAALASAGAVAMAVGLIISASVTLALLFTTESGWCRLFIWLGMISYPLYLTHQNLGYAVMRILRGAGLDGYANITLVAVLALLLAAALHHLVELPLTQRTRDLLHRLRSILS